jgi:tRNA(Ile)-lysidine synthase
MLEIMEAIMPAPRGIIQQFDEYLHRSDLLQPGSRLLVAVSGGADSVALLRLLHAVNQSRHWRFKLVVGHVNHRTRGRESGQDAAFVKRLAKTLRLPHASRALRLKKPAKGSPSEAALRDARLAAITSMARAARCDAVVLAHHADDQAETVLMRLLRGTSFHGLAGIAASRMMGVRFVRPLLEFTRQALRTYLADIDQPWREDVSNQSADYLRNRIRNEVLPLLESLQPQVRSSLVRLAAHAQDHQNLLESLVEAAATRAKLRYVPMRLPNSAKLDRGTLVFESPIVLGEFFRQIVSRLGGSLNAVTAERLAAAIRIATGEHGAKTGQLGGGVTMHVVSRSLTFKRTGRRVAGD